MKERGKREEENDRERKRETEKSHTCGGRMFRKVEKHGSYFHDAAIYRARRRGMHGERARMHARKHARKHARTRETHPSVVL